MPTQTIKLSDAQFEFVRKSVDSGDFNDAGDVISEALRLLETLQKERHTHVEYVRSELQKGFDDYEAGRYLDISTREKRAAYFEDVNRRGLERLAKEKNGPSSEAK